MSSKAKVYTSPSDVHYYLTDNAPLKMAYTGQQLKPWQSKLRKKLKELMGYPTPEPVDLNVRSIWKQDDEFGTIEKIIFTSEKYADVPAYVCIPKEFTEPHNWMVCLQGHSPGMHVSIGRDMEDEFKKVAVEGDRDFAIGCMKRGIAALCIEQRAFGQREETNQKMRAEHRCQDAAMHALALGRTLLAERVFDISRGIDYLLTRDDVNPKRIGVMGNSGGGTASMFAAAVLPKVSFAIVSCYFCTFADSIMRIYHCPDNYIPGILNYAEMSDIMGLFAPKPAVIVAGKEDEIFPIKAVRKEYKKLQKIYSAADAEDKCSLVVGQQGHQFYADLAWSKMLKYLRNI